MRPVFASERREDALTVPRKQSAGDAFPRCPESPRRFDAGRGDDALPTMRVEVERNLVPALRGKPAPESSASKLSLPEWLKKMRDIVERESKSPEKLSGAKPTSSCEGAVSSHLCSGGTDEGLQEYR